MEDMEPGEVAAMYEDDGDAVILVARDLPDDARCAAVNRLLAGVRTAQRPPVRWLASVGSVAALLLTHFGQQIPGSALQGLQALLV